jgi:hypothetical protein
MQVLGEEMGRAAAKDLQDLARDNMCPFLSSFSQVKQERVGVVAVVEVGQRLRERCWSSLVKGVVMTQEKKRRGRHICMPFSWHSRFHS